MMIFWIRILWFAEVWMQLEVYESINKSTSPSVTATPRILMVQAEEEEWHLSSTEAY